MTLPREFIYELHKHFTGEIRTDPASRILYSTDASLYQIEPSGVALPRTQEDLIAAVELAAKYQVPILPRGAGTSLAGQAVGNALILDCSRWLNKIIEIDPDERFAIVEPGTVLATLNLAASKMGLMFGPDPASAERATLGGVIANNATGAHSIVYGMSADHLLAADVILADGTSASWGGSEPEAGLASQIYSVCQKIREKHAPAIQQNFPRTWRNSAGYRLNYLLPWSPSAPPQWLGESYPPAPPSGAWNLASLLAGSEGTLAVIRRLKLNLVPKPKHTILGILAYDSIAAACDDVPRLLAFNPSAVELIPQLILRLARSVPALADQLTWVRAEPAAVLVVEFSGDVPEHLNAQVKQLHPAVLIAETKEAQEQVWAIRKVGLGILDSRPQSARPIAFIEDCAIPVERLGEFVRAVEQILAAHGTYGGIYAHASGGCLHIRPVLDMKTAAGAQAMRAIAEATLALTLSLGGSMSSEHGDGLARSEWLQKTYGAELFNAMQNLKRAADPHNILNPGKLFDAPPMDSHLRYEAASGVGAWKPSLDFTRNGSFVLAIEQCNGQGVCRKATGVMCPSYQATREEQNSTRGRANLLRALIAQPMKSAPHTSELETSTAQALDLCLACKGCKAECPSGVDMAKLKYEFEHRYYLTHSRPWRDYIFGYFHVTAALASRFAPLANALLRFDWLKKFTARLLEITPQRPFPKFVSVRKTHLKKTGGKKVLFLSDPFSRYIEPQVEDAALAVLTACGYDVCVLPIVATGASLLSKGMLGAAKRQALKMLAVLNQVDPMREAVIVGLEPPEIYTFKHDYLDLIPEHADEIAVRAARTWLLDEYLIRSENFSHLQKRPTEMTAATIFFHPHCHQRAEMPAVDGLPTGTHATLEVLRACGYKVELSEAGCCGMAGTFGYEAEHYELSMQVGGLRLFPALLNRTVQVASTGAACRMQIQQGANTAAKHPIEYIAQLVRSVA